MKRQERQGREDAEARTAILALNAGSSSLKFALFNSAEKALLRGQIEGLGECPRIVIADGPEGEPPDMSAQDYDGALKTLLQWLGTHAEGNVIGAVGHRIVHGGLRFAEPVLIDAGVLAALEGLVPLAPLHQPHGLAAVRAIAAAQPGLVQVACFDTAFHSTMPAVATRIAIPAAAGGAVLRRYGFHGLSYEYVAGRLRVLAPGLAAGRVIVAHLGSGASLCAMLDGRSVETTMGFSALDGLVMATRPGGLDPGVVLYLQQSCGMTAGQVESLLYRESGLLGVSGISGDIRELIASGAPGAREAIELFIYRLAGEIARLTAALGGLDGLVFTGGIGEHNADIRAATCGRLGWLNLYIDGSANRNGSDIISAADSAIEVHMIATDEEAVIARHVRTIGRG